MASLNGLTCTRCICNSAAYRFIFFPPSHFPPSHFPNQYPISRPSIHFISFLGQIMGAIQRGSSRQAGSKDQGRVGLTGDSHESRPSIVLKMGGWKLQHKLMWLCLDSLEI